jgi:hypothetical protein
MCWMQLEGEDKPRHILMYILEIRCDEVKEGEDR